MSEGTSDLLSLISSSPLLAKHPADDTQNGDLWIYPSKEDVSLRGKEALTAYEFGRKTIRHLFCGNCGVDVGVSAKDPEKHPFYPINVRTMNGVDVEALKVKKGNGSTWDPPYEV